MRIIVGSLGLAMLLGLAGCEDKDGLSPGARDASAPPDGGTEHDGASDDASLDAIHQDAEAVDTAPGPEIALLEAELSAIVTKPGHELASLAVWAIDNGEVSYEGHFGHAYIDNDKANASIPADKHTLYRIASMSKMVTTIGVMTLVDAGKLNLDADASLYLGFQLRNPHFPEKVITPRMLLSHRSSIHEVDENYILPIEATLESALAPTGAHYDARTWAGEDGASSRPPGGYFSYANLNFGILGSIIEVVSGERFDKFMQAHVLGPMGIKGGYYAADLPPNLLSRVATLYRKLDAAKEWKPDGPWFAQADDFHTTPPMPIAGLNSYMLGKNGTLFGPQGSLRITIADMGRIMEMLLNKGTIGKVEILKPASVAAMQANEWTYDEAAANGNNYGGLFLSWGLGTQRFTDTNLKDRLIASGGFTGFGHLGEAYGLFSGFVYDPVSRDGMIYFIGGVGSEPDEYGGEYSFFYKWEEEILTALHRRAIAHDASP